MAYSFQYYSYTNAVWFCVSIAFYEIINKNSIKSSTISEDHFYPHIIFCAFPEVEANETASDNFSLRESCELTAFKKQVKDQGDEIILLKSALADALRRLQVLEEKKRTTGIKPLGSNSEYPVTYLNEYMPLLYPSVRVF